MLKIDGFSKSYGAGRYAVRDLTLHVAPGEIYGFLGHNGAGKSTTLRAVAGVLDFTEGEITVGGHSIRTQPVEAKRIMLEICSALTPIHRMGLIHGGVSPRNILVDEESRIRITGFSTLSLRTRGSGRG